MLLNALLWKIHFLEVARGTMVYRITTTHFIGSVILFNKPSGSDNNFHYGQFTLL